MFPLSKEYRNEKRGVSTYGELLFFTGAPVKTADIDRIHRSAADCWQTNNLV